MLITENHRENLKKLVKENTFTLNIKDIQDAPRH